MKPKKKLDYINIKPFIHAKPELTRRLNGNRLELDLELRGQSSDMENTSPAVNLEQIDQEITLHLQKIDSDLAYCFTKITKDIIPYVTQYGQTCEEISYSCAWLKEMFQQSANVQLVTDQGAESAGQVLEPRASLFPEVDNKLDNKLDGKNDNRTDGRADGHGITGNNTTMDDFHTAEHALGLGMGSDTDEMTQDSAMEKQRKKRKISLQIQQQFNSSSSSSSSSSNSTLHKDFQENSSPIKINPVDRGTETNNTLGKGTDSGQAAGGQPTVIHFNSNIKR